jgi:myo-inositol-1(or 4)-monophosphatase
MREREHLRTAIEASVQAGKLLMRHWEKEIRATPKESMRDVVTRVDVAAEELIIDHLRRADAGIPTLAEESGHTGGEADHLWLVDALDGTVNYVNRVPLFCVSIALFRGKEAVLGVIFNPMSNDLYYGVDGEGAFKNQDRIRTEERSYEECLFAAAFSGKSYSPSERAKEFELFSSVNDSCRGCLRTGSAAMNLAYLAEGRLGGCWGRANKWWDVGAGLLIARLAGADVAWEMADRERPLVNYRAVVKSAATQLSIRTDPLLGLGSPLTRCTTNQFERATSRAIGDPL